MKKWLICLSLALVLAATAACASQGEDPVTPPETEQAQVIGSINGENIYKYEYDFYFNMFFDEYFTNYYDTLLSYQGVDLLDEESSRELLGDLENYSWQSSLQAALIRQMAAEHNVTLEPCYTDDLLLPANAVSLRTNRLYSDLFPLMREEAIAAKEVSEEDARAMYDNDPASWDNRQVAHIIITTQGMDEEGVKEVRAKVEDIIAQLDAGASFEDLAKEHSQDGSAESGGLLDMYFNVYGNGINDPTGAFDPDFANAAFELENVGDYSPEPVETSFGYHIIKLLERNDGFEGTKDFIMDSMKAITDEEVSAYFRQKMDEKQAAATIEQNFEFKYYVEPVEETVEGTEEGAAEGTEVPETETGTGEEAPKQ